MDIADILLLILPGQKSQGALEVASRLAAEHGATVEGVCLTPLADLQQSDCYAIGTAGLRDVLRRMDHRTGRILAEAEAAFHVAMGERDSVWTAAGPGEPPEETALRARLTDLVVLARPEPQQASAVALTETMVRMGGAPCLLVPPELAAARPFDHVVLGWNGSRQAKRAMDDAMPLLRRARQVTILGLGAAENVGPQHEAVARRLQRKGVAAGITLLSRDDGDRGGALLSWCSVGGADLLVMGAYGRSPGAEHWLGGATWTALTRAPFPVFMSR